MFARKCARITCAGRRGATGGRSGRAAARGRRGRLRAEGRRRRAQLSACVCLAGAAFAWLWQRLRLCASKCGLPIMAPHFVHSTVWNVRTGVGRLRAGDVWWAGDDGSHPRQLGRGYGHPCASGNVHFGPSALTSMGVGVGRPKTRLKWAVKWPRHGMPKHAKIMPKQCQNLRQTNPKTCQNNAKTIPKHAKTTHAKTMPKHAIARPKPGKDEGLYYGKTSANNRANECKESSE